MQWITVGTPPFRTLSEVQNLMAELGDVPEGCDARYLGTASDGTLRVVNLWQTKEHADRFFAERLGPTLARILGPEPTGAPQILGIQVADSYVRQPVG